MNLQHDAKEAVRFLGIFCPCGPWILTAIMADGNGIETESFTDLAAAEKWVNARHGKNLYFGPNPTMTALSNKAKKSDIRGMTHLFVDVDPRTGENLDPERKRIEKLLFEFDPRPSFIIDSGGGAQALWSLDQEQVINGDVEKASELEAYNLQLELTLGADSCHNIDRILRLVGTVNWPNAKKIEKGREPRMSMLLWGEAGLAYPLATFTPAQRVGSGGKMSRSEVKISGKLPRIDLDDLPEKLSQRMKTVIVQGDDPDQPYQSQSHAVFAAACNMVRAGCTDDQIAAVMLDKDFGISAHIYRQARPQDYTARQIKRAKDDAISPELAELNRKHAVLLQEGGKTRVLSWERTELDAGRKVPVLQSFDDFRNRYMNRFVEIKAEDGVAKKPWGAWWLSHPQRREYLGLRFMPGEGDEIAADQDDGGTYLNLWRGFSVDAVTGDWSLMQAHIHDVLAGGDLGAADYIIKWGAFAVQHPDEPAEVALVFRGLKGSGKGVYARTMRNLFGQHGLHITTGKHLTGRFNSHLRDCCLLFADEAVVPGDLESESVLKGLITEPELAIEGKGVNLVQARNRLHIVMASNHAWVVPATIEERRFAVFDVPGKRVNDQAHFVALYAELDNGGQAAMLHDLLNMDLGDWHPRQNIPKTDGRNKQIAASFKGIDSVMLDLLRVGEIPVEEWVTDDQPFVSTSRLKEYAQSAFGRSDITLNAAANMLELIGGIKDRSRRPSGYVLPALSNARTRWNEKKVPINWDDPSDIWKPLPASNGTLVLREWEKKGESPPPDLDCPF